MTFLNQLHTEGTADLQLIEKWWVDRVVALSAPKPMPLRFRKDWSLGRMYENLLTRARRIHKHQGTYYVEQLISQYFLRAILQVSSIGQGQQWDRHAQVRRSSDTGPIDFTFGDTVVRLAIPFTGDAIRRPFGYRPGCLQNVIITSENAVASTRILAEYEGTANRVWVISLAQFLDSAFIALGGCYPGRRAELARQLVDVYNQEAREDDIPVKYMLVFV
ncbi:MAG: hypothetical protein HC802_18220 [Caldilineaceae bacterium]|nr:hypothetical protein [Caldilineaceae bacterium]